VNTVPLDALIGHLQEKFPDMLPRDPQMTVGDLRELQGEQRVIDYIASLTEEDSIRNVLARK